MPHIKDGVYGGAAFSIFRDRRYWLWRLWSDQLLDMPDEELHQNQPMLDQGMWNKISIPYALLIGHNPSTADGSKNDATITREIAIVRRLGLQCLIKLNISDVCATNPGALNGLPPYHLVRSDNKVSILSAAKHARRVLFMTGEPSLACIREASIEIFNKITPLMREGKPECMGQTQSGWPRHPSRLPSNTPIIPFYISELKLVK